MTHDPKNWPYMGQIGQQTFVIEGITHKLEEHGFFIDYHLLDGLYCTFSHGATPPEIIGAVVTDIMQRQESLKQGHVELEKNKIS